MRLLCGCARQPQHVHEEQADQHDRVEQRDRVLQRQRERVERRDPEERDLDRVGSRPGAISLIGAGGRSPARFRDRYQAMNTTELHPMPISSRFAPVMFASAREQGDARPGSPIGHEAPYCCDRLPALPREHEVDRVLGEHRDQREHARARGPAAMSSCATSAAHARRNAAPTIARPNSRASTRATDAGCGRGWRRQSAGNAKAAQRRTRDGPNVSIRAGGRGRGRHRLWRP